MKRNRILWLLAAVLLAGTHLPAAAQSRQLGRENAALGYWMAFALMQDAPYDQDQAALLESVARGQGPWNEARLGPIVERNLPALHTLHRSTYLPVCDWGLDYDLGPDTPIAHLAKARVLGRLNVLYGMRLAAQQDSAGAAAAWLHGVRFARHLAEGSSLIGLLTARAVLESHLQAMRAAVEAGRLDETAMREIAAAIRQTPRDGFDWSRGIRLEHTAGEIALMRLVKSPDPRRLYESWFGEPAPTPLLPITAAEIARYRETMDQAAAAFARPHDEAGAQFAAITENAARLHIVIQRLMPVLRRINGIRAELAAARADLLAAIERRLGR